LPRISCHGGGPGFPGEILPDREGKIGEAIERIDSLAKAAGETVYADDMSLPGMLFTKVLRSERPHAEILGIDIAEASGMPGVARILLGADIPGRTSTAPLKRTSLFWPRTGSGTRETR
jgi:CO/xanthine dehydrogenase Mo-binding subunit